MSARTQFRQLYREIPTMQCIAGCTDCCGPVPLTEYEAKRLGVEGSFTPTDENGKCVFAKGGKCSVYEMRPLMCRIFGTVERMRCPHGAKPGIMLNQKKEIVVLQRYNTMQFKEGFDSDLENVVDGIVKKLK